MFIPSFINIQVYHYMFNNIFFGKNECNICYQIKSNNFNLQCCNNSKKICINCVSKLTSKQCPFCRKQISNNILFSTYFSVKNNKNFRNDLMNNDEWNYNLY